MSACRHLAPRTGANSAPAKHFRAGTALPMTIPADRRFIQTSLKEPRLFLLLIARGELQQAHIFDDYSLVDSSCLSAYLTLGCRHVGLFQLSLPGEELCTLVHDLRMLGAYLLCARRHINAHMCQTLTGSRTIIYFKRLEDQPLFGPDIERSV